MLNVGLLYVVRSNTQSISHFLFLYSCRVFRVSVCTFIRYLPELFKNVASASWAIKNKMFLTLIPAVTIFSVSELLSLRNNVLSLDIICGSK